MDENNNIKTKWQYLKKFNHYGTSYKKQEEALKQALDIRKFEIDLYWKRAAYFWAFIGATFAGYFLLVSKDSCNNNLNVLVICALGFLFSYSWFCVNRASKFWQQNWEMHVDLLEDEVMGPLYKTYKNPNSYGNEKVFHFTEEFPYSVSKINQLLSLFVTMIWIFLAFYKIFHLSNLLYKIILIPLEIAFIIFIIIIYYKSAKSNSDNETNYEFTTRKIK